MIEDADAGRAPRPRSPTLAALDTAEALSVLRRRALPLGTFALLCGGLAYGASFLIPPSYVASAQIFVDPRTIQALDSSQSHADGNAEIIFVESQGQILSSESVLSRVVQSQRLSEDPEFAGGIPGDAATRVAQSALADRVTIRRPERTFVLDVAVRARTAEKAARLANAVAQAYFDEQSSAHIQSAQRANKSLTDRLDELRGRVRQSEERAQAFRREHGLIGTRTQLISEQQLTDANSQLALARARVIQAQSRLDEIRHLGVGDLAGGSPEAIISPTVTLLRGQQAEARRRLDNALAQFGPLHPAVHDARSEVEGLDRAVAGELGRIAQSAKVELQRATSTEAAQRKIVTDLSSATSAANDALVALGELDREIDVNKNLLNTFLNRAGETSELAQVNTSNARIISTAQPPRARSFPPRASVFAILGAMAGLALGVALSLWHALRETPAPRLARDRTEEETVEPKGWTAAPSRPVPTTNAGTVAVEPAMHNEISLPIAPVRRRPRFDRTA